MHMKKKKETKTNNLQILDGIAFLLALAYMQSVLTVAHHTSHWAHNGTAYTVGPPSVPALLAGLAVIIYSAHKNKMSVATLNIISLTIFATASLFWLSGLRTNFYF
jgi:hypothetical protein